MNEAEKKAEKLVKRMVSDYNYHKEKEQIEKFFGDKEKRLFYHNCCAMIESYIGDVAGICDIKLKWVEKKIEADVTHYLAIDTEG